MPNPDNKLPQESPCEIKLACSGHNEEKKKKVCEKIIENEEAKEAKLKGHKSGVDEQATLNKEPCDKESGIACHLARPDHTSDPKSRIDKAKPGCINFETCEEDEDEIEQEEVEKLKTGCLDYENCKEYEKEEKRRIKMLKQEEKQRKKEKIVERRKQC